MSMPNLVLFITSAAIVGLVGHDAAEKRVRGPILGLVWGAFLLGLVLG